MACGFSGGFSSNYMLLKPEEVDIRDLFGILCSSDLEKRKSVDCPENKTENFSRRRIIFVSISVQKFLQSVAKPMASVGSRMEMWLNLFSSNHNLGMLLLNFLRGWCVSSCPSCCFLLLKSYYMFMKLAF